MGEYKIISFLTFQDIKKGQVFIEIYDREIPSWLGIWEEYFLVFGKYNHPIYLWNLLNA